MDPWFLLSAGVAVGLPLLHSQLAPRLPDRPGYCLTITRPLMQLVGFGSICNGDCRQIQMLFDAMDADGDRAVSKFEFIEFLREHKPKHATLSDPIRIRCT